MPIWIFQRLIHAMSLVLMLLLLEDLAFRWRKSIIWFRLTMIAIGVNRMWELVLLMLIFNLRFMSQTFVWFYLMSWLGTLCYIPRWLSRLTLILTYTLIVILWRWMTGKEATLSVLAQMFLRLWGLYIVHLTSCYLIIVLDGLKGFIICMLIAWQCFIVGPYHRFR